MTPKISYNSWSKFLDYAFDLKDDRIEEVVNNSRDIKYNLGFGDYLIFTNLGIVYVFCGDSQNILCYNRTVRQLKNLLKDMTENK